MANARDEAEMVMFPVVEAALKKTGDALHPDPNPMLLRSASLQKQLNMLQTS